MRTQDTMAPLPTGAEADRCIGQAVREALLDHKRTGDPIAVWQDGTVVWIRADEIDVPDAQIDVPDAED